MYWKRSLTPPVDPDKWHRHFALFPMRMRKRGFWHTVWLETVYRKRDPDLGNPGTWEFLSLQEAKVNRLTGELEGLQ